jgi:hypothetical protein
MTYPLLRIVAFLFAILSANFSYQFFRKKPDYAAAFERSYFQIVGGATAYFMVLRLDDFSADESAHHE